ncbi:MAG TPA: hypothetical protein VMM84_14330 [Pyrinomonadaceae bacterium]|nr:hypothetical protein [Pyrinomonadaceae bacterium]
MNEVSLNEAKRCPICSELLPLSEFGICRARKDGRNLYCKSCIRHKVSESRRALKEYKSARKRFVGTESTDSAELAGDAQASDRVTERSNGSGSYSRAVGKLTPVDRVREAIRKGARTQKEIAQETKLGKDEIGDALANLLLWSREIRTEVIDNTRIYRISDTPEYTILDEISPVVPRRKRDVPSSFSSLQGLMPGRNPEGEPEKIGGWVAA